jgi:uncharacterized paraquat-inducible protein A
MPRFRYIFHLQPTRASCPHCHTPLSRHHCWDNEVRPCESCGRNIEPVRQGGCIGIFISSTLVILIALSILGWVSHWWDFIPAIIGIMIEVAALLWLWPYMNKFQPTRSTTLRQCPRCSYDLRATPDQCPECGLTIPEESGIA